MTEENMTDKLSRVQSSVNNLIEVYESSLRFERICKYTAMIVAAILAMLLFIEKSNAQGIQPSVELRQQMDDYPDPPYGRRSWVCSAYVEGHHRVETCAPFTILEYGQEKVTHYRGYQKLFGKARVGNKWFGPAD